MRCLTMPERMLLQAAGGYTETNPIGPVIVRSPFFGHEMRAVVPPDKTQRRGFIYETDRSDQNPHYPDRAVSRR